MAAVSTPPFDCADWQPASTYGAECVICTFLMIWPIVWTVRGWKLNGLWLLRNDSWKALCQYRSIRTFQVLSRLQAVDIQECLENISEGTLYSIIQQIITEVTELKQNLPLVLVGFTNTYALMSYGHFLHKHNIIPRRRCDTSKCRHIGEGKNSFQWFMIQVEYKCTIYLVSIVILSSIVVIRNTETWINCAYYAWIN